MENMTLAGAVIITGLVVVFTALLLLWFIVAIMGKIFTAISQKNQPQKPVQPAPPAPKEPPKAAPQQAAAQPPAARAAAPSAPPAPVVQQPVMAVEDGIGDEIVAVITAAIAAMIDSPAIPAPAVEGPAPESGFFVRSIRRAERTVWSQAGLAQNTQPF